MEPVNGQSNGIFWEMDCLKTHSRVLVGKRAHYCWDWQCKPVDETVPQIRTCRCYNPPPPRNPGLDGL